MIGKTITRYEKTDDELSFYTFDGIRYRFFHSQDCCESVTIEDVIGDLDDLVGSPLTLAEETTDGQEALPARGYEPESCTWTFYKFATVKGYVTVRWFGESNGYYSESVDLQKTVNHE